MDTVKLEAKWPPDRKSTIEASEFGIYKEPAGSKGTRNTDRATGFLLVLSLIAAAAVVLYFTFFDYAAAVPATVQSASSAGPVMNYAKFVKEKHVTTTASPATGANGLLAAVLGVKNAAENYTNRGQAAAVNDGQQITFAAAKRLGDDDTGDGGRTASGRRFRLQYHRYPIGTPVIYGPLPPPYNGYRSPAVVPNDGTGKLLEYGNDSVWFGRQRRRTDFPQLAAYRAPYPPKSVLDVMKYVTGPPRSHVDMAVEQMTAQESRPGRYVPIRPAIEEVNEFLPDSAVSGSGAKRFRNKFGPPVFLTPPMMAFPDDFMKPPSPGARYSMDFHGGAGDFPAVDITQQEGSATVQSHTDVVYHRSPADGTGYPVPDSPAPNRSKKKKPKNKKPISVMLDIYPMSDHEREDIQDDGEDHDNTEILNSLKNTLQQSDRDNLLLRLNLFPKYSEGGRRIAKNMKYDDKKNQSPIVHLTTSNPLLDKEEDEEDTDESEKTLEYEYPSVESKDETSKSKTL